MKKLLLILVLSFGLIQGSQFEIVKNQLTNCTGLNYQGIELSTILANAANSINQDKDELISLVVSQLENNKNLKNKPKQQATLFNNFISNIDPDKKIKVGKAVISNISDESLKSALQERLNDLSTSTIENNDMDVSTNFSFVNTFAEQDFRAKKNLWNIVYCGGLFIFGPSCLKNPDLVDVGITSFCLTGLFFNNKKTTGSHDEQMKQADKNWLDGVCLTGFATAFWGCYQKPSKTNIGLAGLCLASLYYNNKK